MSTSFLLPTDPIGSLDEYLATDVGGLGLQRSQSIGAEATIEEIATSGLRGRGGGGFPTGRKWRSIAQQSGTPRYLVVNGAEGEPGTFKDRTLMRANPYQLVEGLVIAAYAIGAVEAFVCLKASFEQEIEAVTRALQEMQTAGICSDCPVTIVAGPEAYLYGEEKAMLEVIEGREPMPRVLPPYEHGLFTTLPQTGSNPTLVNNVETLSNVPHILVRGTDWFRSLGTAVSPGNLICTVVGDVTAPGVAEVELGTPLRQVIEDVGGGVAAGRSVQAVFSGVSNPVVTADQLGVPLSYEDFEAIGSGMGTGGFIVYDDTACPVEVAELFSRFLATESCGQCSPCKLGSEEITIRLSRLQAGTAEEQDVDEMAGWLDRVTDGNRCYLAVEERLVIQSILNAFPDDFATHTRDGCPRPRALVLPKIADLSGGRVVWHKP